MWIGQLQGIHGSGNNVLISGSSSSAQLYGGSGNNIFIGGTGDSLMVGGKGNDQFYAGSSHDVMIGGGGANYFDCGPNGNGVILDFNAKNGDTKASNCKFVETGTYWSSGTTLTLTFLKEEKGTVLERTKLRE